MTDREAITVLDNGNWWSSLDCYMNKNDKQLLYDATDVAVAALQEREERSEGCEYCKGNEDRRKCIPLETDVCETWISEDNRLVNSYDSCEINFCPMCGRPLKGEDE